MTGRLRRGTRWLILHTGRRGAFLLFLTVLDASYGGALLSAEVRALNGHPSPDFLLPLHAWGWIWAGTAAFIATGVLLRRDIAQFTAASALMAVWGLLYADLWLVQHQPMAWISVVIWLAFALTVIVVAGWPEPGPARQFLDEFTNGNGVTSPQQALPEGERPQELP